MNNSCVVPLTKTGMEIVTDITFGDKMGSKFMTLKPFSYQENYIVVVYVFILLLYVSFRNDLNHTYNTQSISGIYTFSLSVHLAFVRIFVRASVRPFVNFYIKVLH